MPNVKDLRQLPNDLRRLITEARAEAAAEIQESLMNRSPYWTGTFAQSWIVSGTEVQATKPRKDVGDLADGPQERFTSELFREYSQSGKRIRQSLKSPVFIGNETDYAAFVIDKAKSKTDKIFYRQLFKKGARTTPIPNIPDWYDVYTQTSLIFKDIDKGFRLKGFTASTNTFVRDFY